MDHSCPDYGLCSRDKNKGHRYVILRTVYNLQSYKVTCEYEK